MLQSMRELAHSWVVKGLMLILVVSFGIWGIGDMFRGNPLTRAVATVGSENITTQQFTTAFEEELARARQMLGPDITAQQARAMGLADHTLDTLIETSLVEQDLKRLGVDASNKAVMQDLAQKPQLKNKDGKFDEKILQGILQSMHKTYGEFLVDQRKQLAAQQLIGVLATGPTAPQSMVDALYKARGQKRILDIITIDVDSVKDDNVPDDKALQDFYQQNQQPFTNPEQRGLTIATLSTESLAKDIAITDDQVKKEYDTKHDELSEPEKRDLLQVVLQDEDKAKEVSAAAKASGNLQKAGKAAGHETVPLNGTVEDNLPPELAKPVFAMKQSEISDPIKSDLGWHVIQIRKITPAGVPEFDAIKDNLRESMKRDQAVDAATRLVNQLDDELAAGHALEDIADGMKLRLIKIASVDATGKTPDGKDPAELPHKDDVLKSAFAQNNAETSPIMDDKEGNYFVVRTDQVTPSALKPFDSVKADVTALWKKHDQLKQAEAKAESIAKDLQTGKAPASFVEKGIEVRTSKPISMLGDSDPSLPRTALPQILKLAKGETTVVSDNGKQIVLRVADILPAGDTPDPAAEGKIRSEIDAAGSKELTDAYLHYLRNVFPVTIKQDALDTAAQQGG